MLPDGRVCYRLKRPWNDGTTHVVLEPQVLLERLVALVPRPRRHLVTYHGVLAPAAGLRSFVVPQVKAEPDAGCRHAPGEEVAVEAEASCRLLPRRVVPHTPGKRRRYGRRRYSWAELLKRADRGIVVPAASRAADEEAAEAPVRERAPNGFGVPISTARPRS